VMENAQRQEIGLNRFWINGFQSLFIICPIYLGGGI